MVVAVSAAAAAAAAHVQRAFSLSSGILLFTAGQ